MKMRNKWLNKKLKEEKNSMANLFTGHKDEWKSLADIDYFGAFVKAYIPC